MSKICIGAAALNQTPLAWEENKQNILSAIAASKRAGVSVLCLPELCISGYGCEDMFLSDGVLTTSLEVLQEIVPETKDIVVAVGLPLRFNKQIYDVACLLVNGEIAGFVGKQHLPRDGIHYEPRWFNSWPAGLCGEIVIKGASYPIGGHYFNISGITLGFEICHDAWESPRPGEALSGVDIILNPSASHVAFAKQNIRRSLVMEGNKKFSTAYVYTNLIGNEAGRAIYDGATFIASHGKILVEGKRFSFTEMQLTLASIEFDKKTENLSKLKEVKKEFSFPEKDMEAFPATIEHWETGAAVKEEEFSRAVSLGLFDYLRKSKSQGFVVSLSGGADSAAVSCLCALMVKFSAAEMGLKEVFKKLGLKGEPPATEAGLVRRILTCVYQATKNNTAITRDASRKVAQAIGAEFFELNVDKIVSDYVSLIENALQSKLNWKEHDMPLQNIQARVRAPSVWLIANLKNALLLATSNRSEAAVGYTTMDGDTAGGLSPISGIDKAFLRHWLKWLETIGPEGFSAISELNAITSQEPTAELRPAESFQTDEADLMPYLVLDAIERLAIRDKKMPIEIFDSIKNEFPQYQGADLLLWLERFFTLWSRNQWKRERYAPGFHLDDENLDPKTWCRFPILSGGYQRELRELKASLR